MQFLSKSYVGAPPRGLALPPRGNPGSATGWPEWLVEILLYRFVMSQPLLINPWLQKFIFETIFEVFM